MVFKLKCLDPTKEAKLLTVKIIPILLDMGAKLSLQLRKTANGEKTLTPNSSTQHFFKAELE